MKLEWREREAGRIKEACRKGGRRCGNGKGRIAFPTGGLDGVKNWSGEWKGPGRGGRLGKEPE